MIQIVNKTTLPALVPDRPAPYTITVYQSGKIRLSAGLAKEMKVAQGDMIEFILKDGAHYLAKSSKQNGFPLSKGTAPSLHSVDLVSWMTDSINLPLGKINKVCLGVAQSPQYINGFHAHQIITSV